MFTKEHAEKFARSIEVALNARNFEKCRSLIATAESLTRNKRDHITLRSPLAVVPGLSNRAIGFLEEGGIVTVGSLLNCKRKYLKSIPGIGETTVVEITDAMRAIFPKIDFGDDD